MNAREHGSIEHLKHCILSRIRYHFTNCPSLGKPKKPAMIHLKRPILSALLLSMIAAFVPNEASADKSSLWAAWPKDSYYKDYPVFHWYPDEKSTKAQSVYRFGPVGIGIDLTIPAFGMKVKNVEDGSPAAASGKLKPGQIIESINGKTLKDIDPRVLLGNLITQAEATDGKINLLIKENPTAKAELVLIQIPVMGAYSKTWPLNCPKSNKIVRAEADYLAKNGNPLGAMGHDQALMFLLSTGEEKDLEVARGWVNQAVEKTKDQTVVNSIPWAIGHGSTAYCEYYLRTGDPNVLPLIQKITDQAARLMYNGGWNHRTVVNFGYGHLNAAGVHCVKFLMLAKECGVNVDDYTLQASLRHFFRYVGRGNVPYGDNMPEGGFVDNGKVGGLAFAMAAAASLTPDGEKSVYAKARDISAVKSFYNTSWMLHGHTGGGIGEVWRSSAMSLMHETKPTKFREFVDNRTWHLDLSRRYDGSMTVLRDIDYSKSYDNEFWGSGYAMTYTVPRKTLRMTGAPPSKFSKKYQLPERPWGNPADDMFYSLEPASVAGGKPVDVDAEKLVNDASWPILRKMMHPDISDEVLLMYCGHPDYNVRACAADIIRNTGRDKLIPILLDDKDPRVRQAGLMVICTDTFGTVTIPRDRLNKHMISRISKMIADPNESWWVAINAMVALSIAEPRDIEPNVDALLLWLNHDDWWMKRAATIALAPLAAEPKYCERIVPAITDMASRNTVGAAVTQLPKIAEALVKGSSAVQKIGKQSFIKAYECFPTNLRAPGGADMQNAVPHLHGGLAKALTLFPGGFDELYKSSLKILPDEALPYKELYFKTDFKTFGADLTKIMPKIVLEDVIPEYLGENMDAIVAETQWASVQEKAKRNQFAVGALDGMVGLYNEIGITDYNWHPYGPTRDSIQWDYFSYDAPDLIKNMSSNGMAYIDAFGQLENKLDKAEAAFKKFSSTLLTAQNELKTATDALAKGKSPKTQSDWEKRKAVYTELKGKSEAATQQYELAKMQACQAMLAGTLPTGMEKWYEPAFNPSRAKWKHSLGPFANTDGKAVAVEWSCKGNYCGCGEPPKALWEKDVLLMRTMLNVQPLKPDHRYRLLIGGNIHSKQGGPVTVYINGKPVHQQGGFGGRLRGQPRGFFIDKALMAEFQNGKVMIGVAAMKTPKAYISAWLEEMKMPTVGQKEILNALTRAAMMSSEWQELQDPTNQDASFDPDYGKYRFSGKFVNNLRLQGSWKVVDQVSEIEGFTAPRPNNPFMASADTLSFMPNGKTSNPNWIWTGNMLLALDKKEALVVTVKAINGKEYLFLESGGFSLNNPKGWQTPLLVLMKAK